jgi:hypothetical protein
MKRIGILFTLFICIILISGCIQDTSKVPTSTKTVGKTATPTNASTTISSSPQDVKVFVNTMLNNQPNDSNTLVYSGNTLDISSVLHCSLDGLIGAPVILIRDSNGNRVASWYLSKDSKMVSGLGYLQNCYPTDSGHTYIMQVTWDLKDMSTNVRIPPGKYTLLVTVYSYTSNSLLPANGGSSTITIK